MIEKQIEIIKNRPYFFRLKTAKDLDFFLKGYFSAYLVYGHPRDIVLEYILENINPYIKRKFKTESSKPWATILEFISNNENESLALAIEIINDIINEYKMLSVKGNITYYPEFYEHIKDANCFADIMSILELHYGTFGINTIYNFDKFYLGYQFMGDSEKSENELFKEFKDITFINFHSETSRFKEYIIKQFSVSPENLYDEIVSYLASAFSQANELSLFFNIYREFNSKERNNSTANSDD